MKRKIGVVISVVAVAAILVVAFLCFGRNGEMTNIFGKEEKCDFCGETKKCSEEKIWGEKYTICADCKEQLGDAMDAKPATGLEMSKTRDDEKGIVGYVVKGPGSNIDVDLVIPKTYEDLPVIGIAREAFKGCKYLRSVVIPSSVTSISWYGYDWEGGAFEGCTGLKKVILMNGLERLQYAAFRNCTSLESIVIPGSVKEFGYSTFYGCTGLKSVVISDGVEVIGPDTFEGCTSLENLEIGKTVTTIKSDAFRGCTALTEVKFPACISSIEWDAFESCEQMTTIKVGKDIKILRGEENDEVYISDIEIWYTTQIPRTLINRVYNLYIEDTLVTELIIPDSVTELSDVFRDCLSLTKVVIPDHVTAWNFGNCENITEMIIGGGVSEVMTGWIPDSVQLLEVKEGVTAFVYEQYNAWGSSTIVQDSSFFMNKKQLVSVKLPSTLKQTYNFNDCINLKTVILADGITEVGSFAGCTNLESIVLPNTLTSIGNKMFSGCENLASIVIPGSVTRIGEWAFNGCTKLSEVVLQEGLQSIDSFAFDDCDKIKEIVLPKSLKSLRTTAFEYCDELERVIFRNTEGWHYHAYNGAPEVDVDVSDPEKNVAQFDWIGGFGHEIHV